MTIIAIKDGIMACDTGVFAGGMVSGSVRKWVAVPDHKGGGVMASAGALGPAQSANRQMESNSGDDNVNCECAIWLRSDGSVWEKYGDEDWLTLDAPFYAIGCGEALARGAMAAGASAAEAAQICIDHHTECTGVVEVAG